MKQGSTDDPFAEPPDDGEPEQPESGSGSEARAEPESGASSDEPGERDETAGNATTAETAPQKQTLPYIHARESVKDGRTQRPIFLRSEVEDGVDELVDDLEDRVGANVYKTDVMEAAVVLAQENPDLVEAKLREWGYGMTGNF